ncbi:hypothetical protein AQJ64_21770 [Streptomyces griseoruber]|uniref:Uncharacterized protein n=1 Tax=Streptomyces griseoruber TaxID=1943 RepID=A0A124I2W1_9ACTN|nr:hypothetical protein AQJ64_21770 [Streptomyces griseoruber]
MGSVIFTAPPASAASSFCVHTTDAFDGGRACWKPNGDKLEGCDFVPAEGQYRQRGVLQLEEWRRVAAAVTASQ